MGALVRPASTGAAEAIDELATQPPKRAEFS
jgi:hypothetical protein